MMSDMTVREYTQQEIEHYKRSLEANPASQYAQDELKEAQGDLAWFNTDKPRTVYLLTGGYFPDGAYFIRRKDAQVWIDNDSGDEPGIITRETMTGRAFGDLPINDECL